MKSNVCEINKSLESLQNALSEAEKVAGYNGLDLKSARQLRLLTEELIDMLPKLASFTTGQFWIESERNRYSIHSVIYVDKYDIDFRDRVLSVSKSGKNIASVGIMGKIRSVIENMIELYSTPEVTSEANEFYIGSYTSQRYSLAWSLSNYKNQIEDIYKDGSDCEAWDELEKSIIANVADDVVCGIQNGQVEIIIKKKF